MLHKMNMARYLTKSETQLHVTGLQTLRSALITSGSFLLLLLLFLIGEAVLGDPTFFPTVNFAILLGMIIFVLRRYGSRAQVILDEERLRVTVPLLGDVVLDLDSFQSAAVSAPEVPSWVFEAVLFTFPSLLLILEVYHFLSGATVDGLNILFAVLYLVLAFQTHRQRDYKSLVLWFGVHTDWRRHVWSRRKVTFRGPEEVLQEIKRQVETAAGQDGE